MSENVKVSVPSDLVPIIDKLVELKRTSAYASIEIFFQNGTLSPTVKLNAVLRLKPDEETGEGGA